MGTQTCLAFHAWSLHQNNWVISHVGSSFGSDGLTSIIMQWLPNLHWASMGGIHAIGFSGQFLKECNWLEVCFGFGFLPTNYLSYKHWPKAHLLPILGWKLVIKINADKGNCPQVLLVHGHFVPVSSKKIRLQVHWKSLVHFVLFA